MRHQWDIQVKSAFGIGCGGLKLGRKIQEKKNIGLISPFCMKPRGKLLTFKKSTNCTKIKGL